MLSPWLRPTTHYLSTLVFKVCTVVVYDSITSNDVYATAPMRVIILKVSENKTKTGPSTSTLLNK